MVFFISLLGTGTRTTGLDQSRDNSHLTDLSHISHLTPKQAHRLHNHISHNSLHHPPHIINNSNTNSINSNVNNTTINTSSNGHYHHHPHSISNTNMLRNPTLPKNISHNQEAIFFPKFLYPSRRSSSHSSSSTRSLLQSIALFCLISLILAALALTFLLELIPNEDGSATEASTPLSGSKHIIHEIALTLAIMTLSLDLFCLLICAVQFIFAVKLNKSSPGEDR